MKKRFFIRIAALSLILCLALTSFSSCAGLLSGNKVNIVENETTDFTELSVIDQLFKQLSLFELDEEALLNAVIKGYIEGTGDKYAEYFTAEEYAKFTSDNQGETVGVGISVIQNADEGCIEIINVVPDSPAMKAGVLPGDLIVYVGIGEKKESVAEIGYTTALDKLLGEKGTAAEFVVRRDGEEIEFSIIRE